MGNSPDSPSDADWLLFKEADQSAAALRTAAAKAREILTAKDWTVRRFSDLLDEVLPVDRRQQDYIAKAVALSASELDALRRHRVDPFALSLFSLVTLADEFGIQRDAFRALLEEDHKPFKKAHASARGGGDPTDWSEVDRAWARLRAENPARFTSPDPEDSL
jgi:hypothetical protein